MNVETWFMVDGGGVADPRECTPGKDGCLVHKDGRKVTYRPDGVTPRSRSVDPDEERAKAKAKPEPEPNKSYAGPAKSVFAGKAKDMKPEEPTAGYKTREAKGE